MRKRDACPYGSDEAVLKCRDMFSCGWLHQMPDAFQKRRLHRLYERRRRTGMEPMRLLCSCSARCPYCFCDMSTSTSRKW